MRPARFLEGASLHDGGAFLSPSTKNLSVLLLQPASSSRNQRKITTTMMNEKSSSSRSGDSESRPSSHGGRCIIPRRLVNPIAIKRMARTPAAAAAILLSSPPANKEAMIGRQRGSASGWSGATPPYSAAVVAATTHPRRSAPSVVQFLHPAQTAKAAVLAVRTGRCIQRDQQVPLAVQKKREQRRSYLSVLT